MKQCINCHKEIPDEASFCFFCASSQIEKREAVVPKMRRRLFVTLCAIALALVAAAVIIIILTSHKTLDNNSAEIVWKHNNTVWHILLRNSANDDVHWTTPQGVYSRKVPEDLQAAIPLQLYVYDEADGHSAAREFESEIASADIETSGGSGSGTLQCSIPEFNPAFPMAVLVSDIVYDAYIGTSNVILTLTMKDGTKLVLHEMIDIEMIRTVEYSWEDTPLSTTEEIQTFLDEIKKGYEGEDIRIYLAPEVYKGNLSIDDMTVSLTGSDNGTIFEGCINMDAAEGFAPSVSGLIFRGQTAGITASSAVFIENCTFEGCECGIDGLNGSWPMPADNNFVDCATGLHINSSESTTQNALFRGNSFTNCQNAVILEQIPFKGDLYFIDCTFLDNGTDIVNHTECDIKFSFD